MATRYGFTEFDGPPLEPLELYTKKSGAEIIGQLYHFKDKGDREVSLRPEMTPTFARMVAARHKDFKKPMKWFAIPQLFRYERQQKGRLREHFQFNADIVGASLPGEDAEIIALAADILREFNLTSADFQVRLSSREVWRDILTANGIPEEKHADVFGVIDKIERVAPGESEKKLLALALEPATATRILDASEIRSADALPMSHGVERLTQTLASLSAMGLGEYVTLDLRIVRGLAYYSGTVFEIFAKNSQGEPTGRAIAGGGRYDNLLLNLAGVDLPAAGFGMGDVVLGDLLEEKNLYPQNVDGPEKIFVARLSAAQETAALELVSELRRAGWAVEYSFRLAGFNKQFEQARNCGAAWAIVCDDKIQQGLLEVKDLRTRSQETVAKNALTDYLKSKKQG